MNEIEKYTGTFKDATGECSIELLNNGLDLTFHLNKLEFSSTDLENWTLVNSDEFEEEELEQYALNKQIIGKGASLVVEYYLQDYELRFNIPQHFLCKKKYFEIVSDIQVTQSSEGINLKVDLVDLESVEELTIPDFELGLKRICQRISKKYILLNCYTCRYSSYNIYGNSIFGTLLCYKGQKEKFIDIRNKEDYSHIQQQGFETVQETNYCAEFQLPTKDQFLYKEIPANS